MKKIISAITLGAMIAGVAFADVTINLNFRQRANLFANEEGTKTALFTDAYSGRGSDNLSISLSGDIVSFDMQLVTDAGATDNWRSKSFRGTVYLGPVELFGGLWADGKLNGAYRAKSDIDAGNLEGMDFEWKKLGSGFGASPSFFCDNLVQPVNGKGESYALGATYKLGLDNGAVNFNAAYVTNATSEEKEAVDSTEGSTGSLQGHGFALIADGRLDGLGQAEVVFKYGQSGILESAVKKGGAKKYVPAMAFGFYAQPSITRNLILTVGGAGSVVDSNFTDYSVDLRARYQVIPEKLSISSFHSYSAMASGNFWKDGTTQKAIVSNKTTKGIAQFDGVFPTPNEDGDIGGIYGAKDTYQYNGKLGGTPLYRDQILANNIMIRYNVNDKLSVFGIVADMIGMGKDGNKKLTNKDGKETTDAIVQLRASAWAQYYADSNNSIVIGCVYAANDVTDKYDMQYGAWAIPVIFRVKM